MNSRPWSCSQQSTPEPTPHTIQPSRSKVSSGTLYSFQALSGLMVLPFWKLPPTFAGHATSAQLANSQSWEFSLNGTSAQRSSLIMHTPSATRSPIPLVFVLFIFCLSLGSNMTTEVRHGRGTWHTAVAYQISTKWMETTIPREET